MYSIRGSTEPYPRGMWATLSSEKLPQFTKRKTNTMDSGRKKGNRMELSENYAFSGGGRGILSVRVSTDGGKTWYEAELQPVSPPCGIDPSTIPDGDLALEHRTSRQWAWTIWQAEIPIPDNATELEIVCCARDSSNATQPENCKALLNNRGLLMNAWHRIRVKVIPDDL